MLSERKPPARAARRAAIVNRIRLLLHPYGSVTQEDLAARIGVTPKRLSKMLDPRGDANLPLDALDVIVDVLGAEAVLGETVKRAGLRLAPIVGAAPAARELVGQGATALGSVSRFISGVMVAAADGHVCPAEARELADEREEAEREIARLGAQLEAAERAA